LRLTVDDCSFTPEVGVLVALATGVLGFGDCSGLKLRRNRFDMKQSQFEEAECFGLFHFTIATEGGVFQAVLDFAEISHNEFVDLRLPVFVLANIGLVRCFENVVRQSIGGFFFAQLDLGVTTALVRAAVAAQMAANPPAPAPAAATPKVAAPTTTAPFPIPIPLPAPAPAQPAPAQPAPAQPAPAIPAPAGIQVPPGGLVAALPMIVPVTVLAAGTRIAEVFSPPAGALKVKPAPPASTVNAVAKLQAATAVRVADSLARAGTTVALKPPTLSTATASTIETAASRLAAIGATVAADPVTTTPVLRIHDNDLEVIGIQPQDATDPLVSGIDLLLSLDGTPSDDTPNAVGTVMVQDNRVRVTDFISFGIVVAWPAQAVVTGNLCIQDQAGEEEEFAVILVAADPEMDPLLCIMANAARIGILAQPERTITPAPGWAFLNTTF
jgi:hypothetical protein